MSGITLYRKNGVNVQYKPTSQLEPYVRLTVIDDADSDVAGVDFTQDEVDSLEELGNQILAAARALKAGG